MQDKFLFEYAVLRVVPMVEREEFLNVGVIMLCSSQRFLQCTCHFDEDRLKAFSKDVDIDLVKARLKAFEEICAGSVAGGPIGLLPLASRFRWLTAARSTILQTSAVHPGLCEDAGTTLKRLHTQLVG